MNHKTYYFSYGGSLKKLISKLIMLIYNIFCAFGLLFILVLFFSRINNIFDSNIDKSIYKFIVSLEFFIMAVALLFFVVLSFVPQKVVVKQNKIKVYRNCLFLNVFLIFRGFNDLIVIDDISKIYKAKNKDRFLQPIPVGVIDWNNTVIIESKSKVYYVPVSNSDEFIEQVKFMSKNTE